MIKKWVLKAVVQKTISFLPNGHNVNFLFQKYVTKGVFLGEVYFFGRLTHAKNHIGTFEKYIGSLQGKKTLELGTGWYPIVPISAFLSGAEEIYTVDITELCSKMHLLTTINYFLQEKAVLKEYLNYLPEKLEVLENISAHAATLDLKEMLEKLHIKYLIADASQLPEIANGFIDLVHSNNTFEHVYETDLISILNEFKRIVSPEGMMSHFIDMSDHFAHFDKSINIYNFLKFSEKQWELIDNSIQPQNRLRFFEFFELYKKLNIPITDTDYTPGNMEELQSVSLAPKFQAIDLAELAKSHGYIYSMMQKSRN